MARRHVRRRGEQPKRQQRERVGWGAGGVERVGWGAGHGAVALAAAGPRRPGDDPDGHCLGARAAGSEARVRARAGPLAGPLRGEVGSGREVRFVHENERTRIRTRNTRRFGRGGATRRHGPRPPARLGNPPAGTAPAGKSAGLRAPGIRPPGISPAGNSRAGNPPAGYSPAGNPRDSTGPRLLRAAGNRPAALTRTCRRRPAPAPGPAVCGLVRQGRGIAKTHLLSAKVGGAAESHAPRRAGFASACSSSCGEGDISAILACFCSCTQSRPARTRAENSISAARLGPR